MAHWPMAILLSVPLLLAGCAARAPVPPEAPQAGRATIVAVRAVVAPASDVATILGLAGGRTTSAHEYILRAADGRILSVVQADDRPWRAGQDVTVTDAGVMGGGAVPGG